MTTHDTTLHNDKEFIDLRNASHNNLKSINLKIPKNKLVVICGISGSGKSTLAFDVLHAEGKRRYFDGLSSYGKQILDIPDRPNVEWISGIAPSIAISQKSQNRNPRSTVATMSDVHDAFRLLFAKVGKSQIYETKNVPPILFSFNNPAGACKGCNGLGVKLEFDPNLIVPDSKLTLADGAIAPISEGRIHHYLSIFNALGERYGFTINDPFHKISTEGQQALLYGDNTPVSFEILDDNQRRKKVNKAFEGVINLLLIKLEQSANVTVIEDRINSYRAKMDCRECNGYRLNQEALSYRIDGYNIGQVMNMSVQDCLEWISNIPSRLNNDDKHIVKPVFEEVHKKLDLIASIGLYYLSLNRAINTLSGGEIQRLKLVTQIGARLSGVLYVLDEPSVGLHPNDNHCLIEMLHKLKQYDNSIILVEHDSDMILRADHIIEIGPGAGKYGGEVVFEGSVEDLLKDENSITALHLRRNQTKILQNKPRPLFSKFLEIRNANKFNLKNVSCKIPLGCMVCITGVSGSGKSSLITKTLYPELNEMIKRKVESKIVGGNTKSIDYVVDIDQSSIGRTSRSNPATYSGVFELIRDCFISIPEARDRRYKTSHFSFNSREGRCELCRGDGYKKIEMHFLPDVEILCDDCNGSRYKEEVLDIKYKDKSISDILKMSIGDARQFFDDKPMIAKKLDLLCKVGLSYLKLGQSSTTLSGGEAQRLKLSKELSRISNGKYLYILDEPTTGLHMSDVGKLLGVIEELVKEGNSVIVIEHNLDVILNADYIIDMGPHGGESGGEIMYEGSIEDLLANDSSKTANFLKQHIEQDIKNTKYNKTVISSKPDEVEVV